MNVRRLPLRSLLFYWRAHLGVVVGAACATAVLVGALLVGDSVRETLREQAMLRIGRVEAALAVRERFFSLALADRLAAGLRGATVAACLSLQGVAARAGGEARTGIVDVHGVGARFFALGPSGQGAPPAKGKALVNERLRAQLGVAAGDTILLRVEKPSLLPREAVMASWEDVSLALRVEVAGVLADQDFGRFGRQASQIPPFAVFVDLAWLQEQLALLGRVNVLLLGSSDAAEDVAGRAQRELAACFSLADAQLAVRELAGGLAELASDRIFLDDAVVAAASKLEPGLAGVLAYFVNALRKDGRATPYSLVAAVGPLTADAAVPAELAPLLALAPKGPDDRVVLNDWLARDLAAKPGDSIEVDFFVLGADLRLKSATRSFAVDAVVPLSGAAADPSLMPTFPGLDTGNCRDWQPGVPVDLDRIRDVDERYWDDHRGTPKAFNSLATGRRLWGNRFGSLTALRGPRAAIDRLAAALPRALDPASLGFFFEDVRTPALAAASPATDFGGLFLGLSFFLIAAALLLVALLFALGVEQRSREIGTLLAVGYRPRAVRRLFFVEALGLATLGGVLGAGLGVLYTLGVLRGLATLWSDAVSGAALSFHARGATIALGTLASVGVALLAMALAVRRACARPAVELLGFQAGVGVAARSDAPGKRALAAALACAALALGLVLAGLAGGGAAAGTFFAAGALLLVAGLLGCRTLLALLGTSRGVPLASLGALAARNAGRRRSRSLATVALLASGTFLVVAVQANRLEPPRAALDRASGTGGFALYGRTTLPVLRDLAMVEGRAAFGLEEQDLADVSFVPMRVRDGDDASCRNLSLVQEPRLVGVRPQELASRGAFRFARRLEGLGGSNDNPWLLLEKPLGDGVVPAIGDDASVTWTLHKKLGDGIEYRDAAGRPFEVRIVATLAGSLLQGDLLIAEDRFVERFPLESGHRAFLVDVPQGRLDAVAARLSRALQDVGLELVPASERLASFQAVQNTYLAIFGLLGGLGLLLGSLGLGAVVLRNALERRTELAVASAVGYRRRAIVGLVFREHVLLLGLGLVSGLLAALVAVLPAARSGLAVTPVALLVGAVGLSGVLWVWLAAALATRGFADVRSLAP